LRRSFQITRRKVFRILIIGLVFGSPSVVGVLLLYAAGLKGASLLHDFTLWSKPFEFSALGGWSPFGWLVLCTATILSFIVFAVLPILETVLFLDFRKEYGEEEADTIPWSEIEQQLKNS